MKLIVGNFKMNLLLSDINNYIKVIKKEKFNNVVFCPSNIYLQSFINNNLVVGTQDISSFELGAYTGDVSVLQYKSLGVKYAIIGHSERRSLYNDSEYVNDKLKLCKENEVIPILCVGETKEEYDNKLTFDVIKKELDEALLGINPTNCIIAYEPIWAIGTGLVPKNEEIYNTISYIKKYINERFSVDIKVLYGGSVNNKNINELELISNIDGYLIGGTSIKVLEFIDLINFVNNK